MYLSARVTDSSCVFGQRQTLDNCSVTRTTLAFGLKTVCGSIICRSLVDLSSLLVHFKRSL
jgi:hypothetical protein